MHMYMHTYRHMMTTRARPVFVRKVVVRARRRNLDRVVTLPPQRRALFAPAITCGCAAHKMRS